MKNAFPTTSLFRGAALMAIALGALAAGCASEAPHSQLTLTSVEHDRTFAQQFSHAFVSRDPDGTTDLVLLDRAAEGALIGTKGNAPVRQIMHLRVLWNPKRDQKAEHNSASNATLHWYVMGNTPDSSCHILEYAGTAFVLVNDSEDGVDLTIRNAAIKPVACRGDLQDPVGSCTMAGAIHATANRRRVREALNSVCTVVSANDNLPRTLSSTARPERPSSLAR